MLQTSFFKLNQLPQDFIHESRASLNASRASQNGLIRNRNRLVGKETTSTNPDTGDEEYKDTDLSKIEKTKRRTLVTDGTDHLSDKDLLALLISPGYDESKATQTAADLLQAFDKDLITLFTASIEQLTKVKGIGFVKACRIKAAFELIKRTASYSEEHPKITSSDDVIHLLAPHMKYLKQEEFRVLLLDSRKRLIRHQTVSLGSLDKALVEPRDVFRPAIRARAKSIILVHNHPSGDPTPSKNDIELTVKLSLSGEILDINVLDHIIIGFSDHVSFKDKELM